MPIVLFPDPHLRHECRYVRVFDRWLYDVCDQMFDEVERAKGIGLAATQVGLPFTLFVMTIPEKTVYINPVIQLAGDKVENLEACLSIPGIVAPVWRYSRVRIDATDRYGKPFTKLLTGLAARCAQHEYDHLQGILFIDRVSRESHPLLTPALSERIEEYTANGGSLSIPQTAMDRLAKLEQKYCYEGVGV